MKEIPIGDVKGVETKFPAKSVGDEVVRDGWGPGRWVVRTRDLWKRL